MSCFDWAKLILDVISIFTPYIVLVFTIQSERKKTAPCFSIKGQRHPASNAQCVLVRVKNVGKSTAYEVQISSSNLFPHSDEAVETINGIFESGDTAYYCLYEKSASIRIFYKNERGKKYEKLFEVQRVGKDAVSVVEKRKAGFLVLFYDILFCRGDK